MKRHFGARPVESFTRSKYWIAASLKSEGTVLDLERKLTSIANDRCLRDRTFFRRNQTHLECGSHGTPPDVELISARFCSSLTPSFLKERRDEPWHLCIELSEATYNVYVTKFRQGCWADWLSPKRKFVMLIT